MSTAPPSLASVDDIPELGLPPIAPPPPPPAPVPSAGYLTEILSASDAGQIVTAGRVTVFTVEVRDGIPVGPRTHVLDAGKGDAIFGGVADDCDYRFLIVKSDDAAIRPLAFTDWADPTLRGKAERWAERIAGLVAADFPLADAPAATGSAGLQRVPAGKVFRPAAMSVLWVTVDAGAVEWWGLPLAPAEAGPVVLPVPTRAWLRATEDAALTIAPEPEKKKEKPAGRAKSVADINMARSKSMGEFALERKVSYAEFNTGGRVTFAELALGDPGDWIPDGLSALNTAVLTALRWRTADRVTKEAVRLARRKEEEAVATTEAIGALARAVGPQPDAAPPDGGLMAALHPIGKIIGVKFREPAVGNAEADGGDLVAVVARASKVRSRMVQLRGKWWENDAGPLLGFLNGSTEDDQPTAVALLRKSGKYVLYDPRTNGTRPLSAADRASLAPSAVMFYRPFPDRPLQLIDLPRFAWAVNRREAVYGVMLALGVTLLGMLLPIVTRWLIDGAIPDADPIRIWELAAVLIAGNLLTAVLLVLQGRISLRMQEGVTAALQAATWDRVLRLPAKFFRDYASGDLMNRSMMVTEVSHKLSGAALRTLFTGGLAVLNLGLLLTYSAKLASIATLVGLLTAGVSVGLAFAIRRFAVPAEKAEGELFGLVVQLVNGAAKLRVAGAARRAFNHWAGRYAGSLTNQAKVAQLHDYGVLFHTVVTPLSTLAIFMVAAGDLATGKGMTLGQFLAFNSAYAMFVGGLTAAAGVVVDLADSVAKFQLMKPILTTLPEAAADRADPGRLTGAIAAQDIVFRYTTAGPAILNGVSVAVAPGEFVALVGPSGSGKSTLLRLLLGFEKPESGTVMYDGMPLDGLDPTAVRRQLGVVLQAATITAGSIFDNIAFGNPMTPDEALQAAKDAGLEGDLKAMPMGLHTVVSEGGTNLSGGQRQRLMIARAMAANPRIIVFDEATSALDNVTQAIVTDSLNRRKVTRLVVAHRLSTVRTADRIYVLADGAVKEQGGYDELVKAGGLFATMVARQTA